MVLTQIEAQVGWHLQSDHERMAFYDYLGQGVLPAGKHPAYPASIDTVDAICDYLNEVKTNYNLHIADTDVHINADSDNPVTADDADDEATAYTLANDIKDMMNAHTAATNAGGAHTHTFTATTDGHTHDMDLQTALTGIPAISETHTHDVELTDSSSGTAVKFDTDHLTVVGGGTITTEETLANATVTPSGPVEATTESATDDVTGTTDSGGGGGGSAYHKPFGDNTNTILSDDATDFETLQTLALEIVTKFRRHLFIGPARMDEDMTFATANA